MFCFTIQLFDIVHIDITKSSLNVLLMCLDENKRCMITCTTLLGNIYVVTGISTHYSSSRLLSLTCS